MRIASPSPLLARVDGQCRTRARHRGAAGERRCAAACSEMFDDVGRASPSTLAARARRCAAAHAAGRVRLPCVRRDAACARASSRAPVPGLDPRERGMLMHKALELVWRKLKASSR